MDKRASVPVSAAAVLAAGLTLAGCGGSAGSSGATTSATASAGTASSANASSSPSAGAVSASVPFPIAVGNTWTYKITASGETGTTINEVTAVKPVAGGQQVTMTTMDRQVLGTNASSKETYIFRSDGSIVYPLSPMLSGNSNGVSISGNGVVWPPKSVLESGKPSKSDLKLSIKAAGQTISTTARITVQGEGTETVTVPAGTYQATVVNVTEALPVEGVDVTVQIKTWLAPGVGPVKAEVVTKEAGINHITATEALESFKQG